MKRRAKFRVGDVVIHSSPKKGYEVGSVYRVIVLETSEGYEVKYDIRGSTGRGSTYQRLNTPEGSMDHATEAEIHGSGEMKVHKVGDEVLFESAQHRGTKVGKIKRVIHHPESLMTPLTVLYDIECYNPVSGSTVHTGIHHMHIVAPNLDVREQFENACAVKVARDIAGEITEVEDEKSCPELEIKRLKAALETEARRYTQLLEKHDKALAHGFKMREENSRLKRNAGPLQKKIIELQDENTKLRDEAAFQESVIKGLRNDALLLTNRLNNCRQERRNLRKELESAKALEQKTLDADKTALTTPIQPERTKLPEIKWIKHDGQGRPYRETTIYAYRVHHITSGQKSMEWSESETFELPGTQRSLYRLERAPEHDMISKNYIKHQDGRSM